MVETLDTLWKRLGLDSLLPAAGNLRATITRDGNTVRFDQAAPVTVRADLPRITLDPPAVPTVEGPPDERDLAVIGLLGEGGMGQVLLARQNNLGREVAVKVAHPRAAPSAVVALLQEARITGGLEHPGVIPVYALASDATGRPALVMKRVEGVPWSRMLDGSEPAPEVRGGRGAGRLEVHVGVLVQVCNAIAFAHSRGVLHRDIKPANVLVGDFGEVYVADWGLALRKGSTPADAPAALVGTPCYLAPEMVTGQDAQSDERTDVFLLGASLYEVLAGRPPWLGEGLREVCEAAWLCVPPPLPADAPAELARICRRAMARHPADRFPSVVALREALGDFLSHLGSVRLADATGERLATLRTALQSGAPDRAAIYSLLSECRFGFTMALREWPENAAAREGLRECLVAAVRHEIAGGNAAAARAIAAELDGPPAELEPELRALEARDAKQRAGEERLRWLKKELDPRIALRQRRVFLVVISVTIVAMVVVRNFVPWVREAIVRNGGLYSLAIMLILAAIYAGGLWVGRGSLLGTRVDRQVAAVVGASFCGAVLNRALAILTGNPVATTLVGDLCVLSAVSLAGGLVLHWGFLGGAAVLAAGALAGALFPEFVSLIFGVSAVVALAAVGLSWRSWRSALSDNE